MSSFARGLTSYSSRLNPGTLTTMTPPQQGRTTRKILPNIQDITNILNTLIQSPNAQLCMYNPSQIEYQLQQEDIVTNDRLRQLVSHVEKLRDSKTNFASVSDLLDQIVPLLTLETLEKILGRPPTTSSSSSLSSVSPQSLFQEQEQLQQQREQQHVRYILHQYMICFRESNQLYRALMYEVRRRMQRGTLETPSPANIWILIERFLQGWGLSYTTQPNLNTIQERERFLKNMFQILKCSLEANRHHLSYQVFSERTQSASHIPRENNSLRDVWIGRCEMQYLTLDNILKFVDAWLTYLYKMKYRITQFSIQGANVPPEHIFLLENESTTQEQKNIPHHHYYYYDTIDSRGAQTILSESITTLHALDLLQVITRPHTIDVYNEIMVQQAFLITPSSLPSATEHKSPRFTAFRDTRGPWNQESDLYRENPYTLPLLGTQYQPESTLNTNALLYNHIQFDPVLPKFNIMSEQEKETFFKDAQHTFFQRLELTTIPLSTTQNRIMSDNPAYIGTDWDEHYMIRFDLDTALQLFEIRSIVSQQLIFNYQQQISNRSMDAQQQYIDKIDLYSRQNWYLDRTLTDEIGEKMETEGQYPDAPDLIPFRNFRTMVYNNTPQQYMDLPLNPWLDTESQRSRRSYLDAFRQALLSQESERVELEDLKTQRNHLSVVLPQYTFHDLYGEKHPLQNMCLDNSSNIAYNIAKEKAIQSVDTQLHRNIIMMVTRLEIPLVLVLESGLISLQYNSNVLGWMWIALQYKLREKIQPFTRALRELVERNEAQYIINFTPQEGETLNLEGPPTLRNVLENSEKLQGLLIQMQYYIERQEYVQCSELLAKWAPRLWIHIQYNTCLDEDEIDFFTVGPQGQYYCILSIAQWLRLEHDTLRLDLQSYLLDIECNFSDSETRNQYIESLLDQFQWWAQLNYTTIHKSPVIQSIIFKDKPSNIHLDTGNVYPTIYLKHTINMIQSPDVYNLPRAIMHATPTLHLQ